MGLFFDAGNIWNVLDNVTDPEYRFDGFKDLRRLPLVLFTTKILISLFLVDTGFKTYNPHPQTSRWKQIMPLVTVFSLLYKLSILN